jgi:hypothetical protein
MVGEVALRSARLPLQNLATYIFTIHFDIVLQCVPKAFKLSLLFRFSGQNSLRTSNLSHLWGT